MDTQILLPILLDDVFFVLGSFFIVNLALLERSKACARMAIAGSLLLLAANVTEDAGLYLASTQIVHPPFLGQASLLFAGIGSLAMIVTGGMIAMGRCDSFTAMILPSGYGRSLETFALVCQAGAYSAFALLAWRKGHAAAGAFFLLAILAGLASNDIATSQAASNLGLRDILASISPWADLLEQVFFALGAGLLYFRYRRNRDAELNRYLEGVYS